MTTKLIDMNLGVRLTLLVEGQEKIVEWSAAGAKQPREILGQLHAFVMEQLEMGYLRDTVSIAKSTKIKALRAPSQKMFNKKLKELGYD